MQISVLIGQQSIFPSQTVSYKFSYEQFSACKVILPFCALHFIKNLTFAFTRGVQAHLSNKSCKIGILKSHLHLTFSQNMLPQEAIVWIFYNTS